MASSESKLSEQELSSIKASILEQIKAIQNKPLKVSIIGQTGVGKSSLLNALFNLKLKTDAVKPCTKEIEEIPITNKQGHTLFFYDLPGIGESTEADAKYLQHYRSHLLESDIVLWAIHADNRSVTFDLEALNKIMDGFDKVQQAQLVSKLTFVLTKVDVLYSPPWFLLKMDNSFAKFIPSKGVMDILTQKAAYYQEQFLRPYGNLIVSKTFNDCRFNIKDQHLSFDESFVYYNGFMDNQTLSYLKGKYSSYSAVFDRLYDNYQVVPCSASLRFNLTKLMLVIVNKLGQEAVIRFKNFFEQNQLDMMQLAESKKFGNLIVYDPHTNKKLFDFSDLKF
jgi:GTP-binding protein EngB required for normal cell division